MKNNIVFNYLPPAQINLPSSALSSLKSYIEDNGFPSKIIYWNIHFSYLMIDYLIEYNKNNELLYLIPFLNYLNKNSDLNSNIKIQIILKRISISKKVIINQYDKKFLNKLNEEVDKIIDTELSNIDHTKVILYAFSSKFFQWIPALIISQKIKKINPSAKIVIGGFSTKEEAIEVLRIGTNFDFSVWGEGELSLLEITKHLNTQLNINEIPQVAYRIGDKIHANSIKSNHHYNFNNYKIPDYTDYFNLPKIKYFLQKTNRIIVSLPIDSSRGCHWNKCKFCYLNYGYKYKEREIDCIIHEMEYLVKEYGISRFSFMSNDLIGKDIQKFDKFLDKLIHSAQINNISYNLNGEIVHYNIDSLLIKKMAIAGFKNVQIGFEALADSLLEKMHKKTSFAHNLMFVKFAHKYGIGIDGANVIVGLLDENLDDIIESMNNLHFLRFFLSNNTLNIIINDLQISHNSRYFKELNPQEKEKWTKDEIFDLVPNFIVNNVNRFNLFSFHRNRVFETEWEHVEKTLKYYYNNNIEYRVIEENNEHYYQEYEELKLIKTLKFEELELKILKITNDKVINIKELISKLKSSNTHISESLIISKLQYLKNNYILYHNYNYQYIISLININ
ncbi:MAG: radical SAM protein [Bacteroidales bacterium]|nr:radical SAM protein [Bacteroidales bacterium]